MHHQMLQGFNGYFPTLLDYMKHQPFILLYIMLLS